MHLAARLFAGISEGWIEADGRDAGRSPRLSQWTSAWHAASSLHLKPGTPSTSYSMRQDGRYTSWPRRLLPTSSKSAASHGR